MDICKAPTLRLKALNKRTHIMYIEMENVIRNKREKKERKEMLTLFLSVCILFCLSFFHVRSSSAPSFYPSVPQAICKRSGTCLIVAGICILVEFVVYVSEGDLPEGFDLDYSFGLTVVACVLGIAAGIFFIVSKLTG